MNDDELIILTCDICHEPIEKWKEDQMILGDDCQVACSRECVTGYIEYLIRLLEENNLEGIIG